MRKLFNGLTTMALGLVLLGGGHLADRLAVAEPPPRGTGLPGATTTKSIGSSLKSGIAKMGDMLTPTPSVKKAPDPISLSTKATPSPELYFSMATVAEEAGNAADARKHYEQALALAPDHFDVILQYARFEDRHNRLVKATELYQRAESSDPNESSVLNDLGLCLARRNLLTQSLSKLERAVQLEPNRQLYRNNIATVLVEQGDVDAAFGHLMAVHVEAVAYYNLGYLMLQRGEARAAARLFAEAVAKNPSLMEAKIWLRELESNGVGRQNGQRQDPRLQSATRQSPQTAGTPELSMRPSRAETTAPGYQPSTTPHHQAAMSPTGAASSARNSPYSAPLPPRTVVPEGDRPHVSGPVILAPGHTPDSKSVPVFQPLPPVRR